MQRDAAQELNVERPGKLIVRSHMALRTTAKASGNRSSEFFALSQTLL